MKTRIECIYMVSYIYLFGSLWFHISIKFYKLREKMFIINEVGRIPKKRCKINLKIFCFLTGHPQFTQPLFWLTSIAFFISQFNNRLDSLIYPRIYYIYMYKLILFLAHQKSYGWKFHSLKNHKLLNFVLQNWPKAVSNEDFIDFLTKSVDKLQIIIIIKINLFLANLNVWRVTSFENISINCVIDIK